MMRYCERVENEGERLGLSQVGVDVYCVGGVWRILWELG